MSGCTDDDAVEKMVAMMTPKEEGVMTQPEAWVTGIRIARKRGAPDLSKSIECWEIDLAEDPGYRLVVNGSRLPLKCSTGVEISPIHVAMLFEGFLCLVASAEEASLIAGIGILDERHYMDILRRELDRDGGLGV